jgi:uncharacterized protein with GYD domain
VSRSRSWWRRNVCYGLRIFGGLFSTRVRGFLSRYAGHRDGSEQTEPIGLGRAGHALHFCDVRVVCSRFPFGIPVEKGYFIVTLNWTDQGIRSVKEAPKRIQAARERAKKFGVEIKQVFLTSGESDLLVIMETANGDNIAKFALMSGANGNVRSRTVRAWPEAEMVKLISELP